MSHEGESMHVGFHGRAGEIFFAVYHAFEKATSGLNRSTEEYRFQQLKKQYAASLEQELQSLASDILMKHKDEKQVGEVSPMFHRFITDYLHRFVQKANAL